LESALPFPDESFDLAFSFFVLEHINDLPHFFSEVYRILRTWWGAIMWYFLQRREFIRKKDKDQFKIQLFNYRIQDIEKIAKEVFFQVKLHPIHEKGYLLWWDIELRK
jgi:ubiquinone/menaquinone biosynthesis C-methylase UbiE